MGSWKAEKTDRVPIVGDEERIGIESGFQILRISRRRNAIVRFSHNSGLLLSSTETECMTFRRLRTLSANGGSFVPRAAFVAVLQRIVFLRRGGPFRLPSPLAVLA